MLGMVRAVAARARVLHQGVAPSPDPSPRPLDTHVYMPAASGGLLDALEWLHAKGCPWDKNTSTVASEKHLFEIVKWLHTRVCPLSAIGNSAQRTAGISTWSSGCTPTGARGCDDEAATTAADHGHLEIAGWLLRAARR